MATGDSNKKYFTTFTVVAACAAVLVALLNLTVDPLGVFGIVDLDGFNHRKVMRTRYLRIAKAYAVERIRPQTVILGTSRAEGGLDPANPAFRLRPVYNLALPAATGHEMFRYLQHADSLGSVKQALLAVEFTSFNIYNSASQGDFSEDRLQSAPSGSWLFYRMLRHDLFPLLLALDMTKLSLNTWRGQNQADDCLDNGFRDWNVKLRDLLRAQGIRASFAAKEEELIRDVVNYKKQTRRETSNYTSYIELLDYCYQRGIDLRIVISPNHLRHFLILREMGLWTEFEAWQRQLLMINESRAIKHGRVPFPLWDFSAAGPYTTEVLPPGAGIGEELSYQWEISHYKKELGDQLLARVYGPDNGSGAPSGSGFGVRLTRVDVPNYQERSLAALLKYETDHQGEMRGLREKINKYYSLPESDRSVPVKF